MRIGSSYSPSSFSTLSWISVLVGTALIGGCALQTETVSGTARYLERAALPPDAIFEVRIEDTSLADAAAQTLVSKQISDKEQPFQFELQVPTKSIDPQHSYSVSARITRDGELLYITDSNYPVLTRGHDNEVELHLTAVPASTRPELKETHWQLETLGNQPLTLEQRRQPFLQLDAKGQRVSGHSGCNAFGGQVSIATDQLKLGPLMGTRMMCDDATMAVEDQMEAALGRIASWRIAGQRLLLLDDQGQELLRFVAAEGPQ